MAQTTDTYLDNARQECEVRFIGDFMQPEIVQGDWYNIDGDNGIESYPAEYFYLADCIEDYENMSGSEVWESKTVTGYGARLSAPGYLDCTEWSVFETELEAIQFLLETYAD